jgi:hypothetical protein
MLFSFPGSLITPIACVAVTLTLLTLVLSSEFFGYGAANIFAYHGAFMVVGVVLLMPLAALSYSFDFGVWVNKQFPTRESRRVLHGTLNMLAFFFVVLGYLVAFAYHQANPRAPPAIAGVSAHLPFRLPNEYSPKARSAHVVLGWFTLAGTVLLSLSGMYKFVQAHKDDKVEGSRGLQQGLGAVTKERVKVFMYHGASGPARERPCARVALRARTPSLLSDPHSTPERARAGKIGPVVWFCGLLCICLAAWFEYQEKNYKPAGTTWTVGEAVLVWVLVALLFVLVSSHFIFGPKKHIKEAKDVLDENQRGLLQ